MRILRTYMLLCFVSALLFVSCKDSSTSTEIVDDIADDSEIIVNPNTKAIDETNWHDFIQEIDSTNFTLTFDDSFDETENWREGDLLVSAIGKGLLRKISSVTQDNGAIIITTEQATLVDYIQQGRISERVSLGLEDVQQVTYFSEGVTLLLEPEKARTQKLYAEKAKGLPWELDTSFSGEGSIEIFGDYLLETDLIFELDVRFPSRLQYFEMSYELKNTLAVGMEAEQNLMVSSSTDIAKVTFNPITIILPVLPAPIVIIPTLVVSIGVDGEVTGGIYTDVRYENIFTVGTAFQRDQGWNEILEREDTFEFNPPTLGLNAMVEAYLTAKYDMALYGVLSGYLTSKIYSSAEAGLNRDPRWELYLGLQGGIGASATVISIDLFDVNYGDLIDFQWPIAQAEADNVPIVIIESVDQITSNSATVTGKVERESGSSPVTERGVCWSINNNPTINDDCNQEGDGDGTLTTTISGLNSGTQYYVRSYAINNAGTAYSTEQSFTTNEGESLATVSTKEISSITTNSAQSGGNVTDDGGATVTARGVCWSTTQNPTRNDNCTSDGSGVGEFTSNLTGLNPDTEYFVRAYATNEQGTGYGDERNFTTDSASDGGDGQRDTETEVVDVYNPATGQTWMDRNLGASRVATSMDDEQAYGDLYQWGRPADGHQKRNSGTTSTLSSTDTPGHGSFILSNSGANWDWRSPQNSNLWQGVNGTNNPCPDGYRLPTDAEWEAERQSWSNNNRVGAFESPLKLPVAGGRNHSSGSLGDVGSFGFYWSSSVSGTSSRRLLFGSSYADMLSFNRAIGASVRCLKN